MTLSPANCPFCLENKLLKSEILAETDGGFLVPALGSEGNFLIIPKIHTESPADCADDWWHHFKLLFAKLPDIGEHYNVSFNVGEHAGQTVKHLHFWIIPRRAGLPGSGMGLATLLDSKNKE